MKALIIRKPKELNVEEVPIPKIREDEILVKVRAVGICGSDIEIKNGTYPDYIAYPIIPGHETAGEVVEVGSNVLGFDVGDRVAVEPHGGCGQCRNCKIGYYSYCLNYGKPGHRTLGFTVNGGFAEYVAAPARNAHKLLDNLSFEEGAMAVSAGTSMFGVMEIGLDPGETVVIVGPGPIGLTSLSITKALGAGTTIMVGTRWARLNLAKELGADILVNVREGQDPVKIAMDVSDGLGVDLVINTTPSAESVIQSVKMLRRGGRLLMLGITWEPTPLVLGEIVTKGLTIKGTRGEARNALERVINLASSGKIDLKKIITNIFPLSDVIEAFEVFEKRIGDPIKVVVKPT